MAASSTFFTHCPTTDPPSTVELSEGTRYMCAAAYLIPGFPVSAIRELIDDRHRAVVPSAGFDIGPVIRHCYRALNLLAIRDALLTSILLIGLVVSPYMLLWVAIAGTILIFSRIRVGGDWRVRSSVYVLAFLVVSVAVVLISVILGRALGLPPGEVLLGETWGATLRPDGLATDGSGHLIRLGLLVGMVMAVYTGWRMWVYRTIAEDLGSGEQHQLPNPPARRTVRDRLRRVSAAQWGNIALQAHRHPFLGAGMIVHSWSMSLELRRPDGSAITVDPVELKEHIQARLEAMRGSELAEQEQISSLIVFDHIVATGERRPSDPLIDPAGRVPYSKASPEAIKAIIRHPQGSLRYYLRVVVGAEGRDVRIDDELVTAAQDQEISVSAFVYVAVEGGMLYLEFVAAVLPPIHERLHVIDRMIPERIVGRAVGDALNRGFLALAAAPVELGSTLSTLLLHGRRQARADVENQGYRTYDYGARISVRELASAPDLQNHLQKLDAEKYYKLVERRTTGAVLDFLAEHGVDTSEYQARTMTVLNQGVMITGGEVNGPVAAGTNAVAASFTGAPVTAARTTPSTGSPPSTAG